MSRSEISRLILKLREQPRKAKFTRVIKYFFGKRNEKIGLYGRTLSSLVLIAVLISCGDDYTPKPTGYYRLATPEHKYDSLKTDCPYIFEKNVIAKWRPKKNCWGDLKYPELNATLQLTYKEVDSNNLKDLLNDGHKLAYKHTVKANGIKEQLFVNPGRDVYGMMYRIQGDAATSAQFFMTDSTQHFLRGVLYFYAEPNADSLRPLNNYMATEMKHMIETLQWQNSSP